MHHGIFWDAAVFAPLCVVLSPSMSSHGASGCGGCQWRAIPVPYQEENYGHEQSLKGIEKGL
jgi:hypothetical protein